MTIRSIVLEEFAAVARQQHRVLRTLTDDLELLELGLDSLSFAQIVIRIEDKLGIYPFTGAGNMQFPETIGDFIAIFVNAEAACSCRGATYKIAAAGGRV